MELRFDCARTRPQARRRAPPRPPRRRPAATAPEPAARPAAVATLPPPPEPAKTRRSPSLSSDARAAPSPQPPSRRAAGASSFEERFGTRWVVWIGGVALALGGIFLVRYSIEAGLLGPKVRLFLGALLATALVAAGEWARRQEKLSGFAGLPSAHIPSILTAAGTTVAYATVYAAYALYGFLIAAVRLRAARHRRAGDARGRAAARAGACRARPGRRLRDADAGRVRRAELLGALHLSRRCHRRRLRARAHAAVAVARRHRARVRRRSGCCRACRPLRSPICRPMCSTWWRASRWSRRCHRRRPVLGPRRRARQDRRRVVDRADGLCGGRRALRAGEPLPCAGADRLHRADGRDARDRLAHRSRQRRRAGGRIARRNGDRPLGVRRRDQSADRVARPLRRTGGAEC